MISRKELVLTAVLIVTLTLLTYTSVALVLSQKPVPSNGRIKTVGVQVYSDVGLSNILPAIDWGFVDPGATLTHSCYILNNGNFPCKLSMLLSDWVPAEASTYITLTWNAEDVTLPAGDSVQAILTLSVSDVVTGIDTFSFTATIVGTAVNT